MRNIYLYTKANHGISNDIAIIKDFFDKYKVRYCIHQINDYEDFPEKLNHVDIIFLYDDVWQDVSKLIESQSNSDDYEEELYIIKCNNPLSIEKLELNKNKLLPKKEQVITLKAKNEIIRVYSQKILYFENINRKVYAHTVNGIIEISTHIRELETELNKYGFLSSYISFLVNPYWISNIKGCDIILKNGEVIPLSQKKASHFRAKYKKFIELSD